MMSFLQLMLSRKEVIISLAGVGLLLGIIVLLAVMPVLQRSWKKRMVRQRARKAAQIARSRKNKRGNRVNPAPRTHPVEAAARQHASTVDAVPPTPEVSSDPPAADPTSVEVPEPTSEISSTIQDVLDSVFVNDEANSRYGVLLKDTEPVSVETLVDLATEIAKELGAPTEPEGM